MYIRAMKDTAFKTIFNTNTIFKLENLINMIEEDRKFQNII